jgi:hypothetical protein
MKKEEPAWKAGMGELIDSFLGEITSYGEVAETSDRIAEMFTARITPCILAAEQRGFQAGVNKTGDSVGKLREQLKTAEERGRREALVEAATAIRSYSKEWVAWPYKVQAMADAADLIDPDAP